MRIGVLHPGEMGVTVGAAARAGGHQIVWVSEGRSAATRARAEGAGFLDSGTIAKLAGESEVIISVCPPHAAGAVAESVAAARFEGIYADANAISPATARRVGTTVEAAGASFVDGGVVGPPAIHPGTTRIYLAGDRAKKVAALFEGSPLEAIAIGGPPGSASALKMCYSAYTKGTAALLLAIRAVASAEEVEADLLDEWNRSQPDLPARSEGSARTARKAWRFAGEMEEIAKTFADAGLPGGFHQAAAEIYRALEEFKDARLPDLEAVLEALRGEVSN